MLSSIPNDVNLAVRASVLNNPNAIEFVAFRKVILRAAHDADEELVGGIPTLGGMTQMDTEDEPDVDWNLLGTGMLCITTNFEPSPMTNRDDAVDNAYPMMYALLEMTNPEPGSVNSIQLLRHDVIYMLFDQNVKIAYEIEMVDSTMNIPPFVRRYLLNKRDDLSYVTAFQTEASS